MTGARQRRAYRAALRRIAILKSEIEAATIARDEVTAAAVHAELIDLQHEVRLIEDVMRIAAQVRSE